MTAVRVPGITVPLTSVLTRPGSTAGPPMEGTLAAYFSSPNPLVKELLDLLSAPPRDVEPDRRRHRSPLAGRGRGGVGAGSAAARRRDRRFIETDGNALPSPYSPNGVSAPPRPARPRNSG